MIFRLRSHSVEMVFALGIAYTLLLVASVPDEVFFSGDAGVKALLTKQFSRGVFGTELLLSAPAEVKSAWDSGLFPFTPPFVYPGQNGYTVSFPFFFQAMSAPFYAVLGFRGLYVIPILSVWLLWACFYRTLRRLELPTWASALGLASLIFATHVTLYAAMFWEHTLAALLAYFGIDYVVGRADRRASALVAFASGVACGLVFLLRSEGIVFAIVLAGFAVSTRQSTDDRGEYAFVVGVVASTLAVFALNVLVYGHALGVHSRQVLEDARLVDHLTSAVVRAVRLTGNFVLHVPLTLFVLFYCAVVLRRGRPWPLRGALGICVPCLLFLAALPLITPNPGGKQLGPRYTLLLPPAFALLVAVGAADFVSRRQRSKKLALALLGVALTVGIAKNAVSNSIRLVNDYRTRVAPALRFVRASEASIVVVNDTSVAQELEAAMGTKVFMLALTPAQIALAGRTAAALGQSKVVLGTFADAPVQALPAGMKAEKPESLGGFRFYELSLLY